MAEQAEFHEFVTTRFDRLLRSAYLLTHDWAAAEDLLQEALTKAWFAWSRVETPEPYVRRALATTYTSWRRRKWWGELPTDDLPEGNQADATGELGEREALWRAVGRLSARQREVVVLRFYEDLPVAEVAVLLGCEPGTVKSQTARALAKLRGMCWS